MIICGDALTELQKLEPKSVHCCITSPPYWNLRDYGVDWQYGLELTPEEYISKLVAVFAEVKRVLRDDGTLWLNIGDTYAGGRGGNPDGSPHTKQKTNYGSVQLQPMPKLQNVKPKDLIGIPWMLAFALRSDGWYLRRDIIWAKPNPMPESVRDRPTSSHEYIFLLSKSRQYFYNAAAIMEPSVYAGPNAPDKIKSPYGQGFTRNARDKQRGHSRGHDGFNARWDAISKKEQGANGRNKRSVWTIATQPTTVNHYATFPEEIPTLCILAGTPEGGIVLDPFCGTGTTLLAALKLGRKAIGIDLSSENCKISEERLYREVPMLLNQ